MTTFQEMLWRAVSLDNVLDLVAEGDTTPDDARYLRWFIDELVRERDYLRDEVAELRGIEEEVAT